MPNLEEKLQPLESQIREFWEGCGFEYRPNWERCWKYPTKYPRSQSGKTLPKLSLNSIFKYAVPKVRDDAVLYYLLDKWVKSIVWESKDPTLALFWAIYSIWEVKGNG
uniref:Uncharacterized protein n=1 Tax=viral metagenome TaxID=1070528 RepID=A0A6M3KAY7_9ZZZZ